MTQGSDPRRNEPEEVEDKEDNISEHDEKKKSMLAATCFVVDTTPYAVWSFQMKQDNLIFIEMIDPSYYEHLVNIYELALETEERKYAAVSLRTTYSQALETMFALLAATVQAPNCVVGWMTAYHNNELISVIRKIHMSERVLNPWSMSTVTWSKLAQFIFRINAPKEQKEQIVSAFAEFWSNLAEEFLDNEETQEYNNVKHGLRSRMSGFYLGVGTQQQLDTPATEIVPISNSEFGTQFYVLEPITDRRNLKLVWKGRNWQPARYAKAITGITLSIRNILAFLTIVARKSMNTTPSADIEFSVPTDLTELLKPWKDRGHWFTMTRSSNIEPSYIDSITKEQILAIYVNNEEEAGNGNSPMSGRTEVTEM